MGWIGCTWCEKFWCDFMARTSALIALVQPVLQRVSCSNETLPNAPKHYETHQNMSLWSNGVDRVHSLRKILMRFHGTNLCINCTSSTHFASSLCSNETLPNAPKHYEKLIAKRVELVQLMHKFVPWSHFGIFRNKGNQSTPLDPKLMFVCVS